MLSLTNRCHIEELSRPTIAGQCSGRHDRELWSRPFCLILSRLRPSVSRSFSVRRPHIGMGQLILIAAPRPSRRFSRDWVQLIVKLDLTKADAAIGHSCTCFIQYGIIPHTHGGGGPAVGRRQWSEGNFPAAAIACLVPTIGRRGEYREHMITGLRSGGEMQSRSRFNPKTTTPS